MTETRVEYAAGSPAKAELYLAFTNNTGSDEARQAFVRKFGYEPHEVKSGVGIVLAGPVREDKDDDNAVRSRAEWLCEYDR